MSTKKIKEAALKKGIFLYEDHKLVTRRDFLASGMLKFSAAIVAPTVLSELIRSSVAHACDEVGAQMSPLPAFVQLNLSGGCGLAMNYIPRQRDGLVPADLDLMGMGSRGLLDSVRPGGTTDRYETEMGVNKGFFFRSGFLQGLREVAANANVSAAGQSYLSRTAFIGVAVQSRDDTDVNRVGIASLVASAGVVGSKMNVLTGLGFGATPALVPPPTPISVNNIADLANAVSVTRPLGNLTVSRREAVFNLIKNLSESRAMALASANATALQDVVGCSTSKNVETAGATAPTTSPLTDPNVAAVWGINANSGAGSRDMVFAGCVYNSLIQQAGCTQLNNGGNDYHNNTRTAGDAKDLENGRIAGRILQTAAVLGRKVFLYVTSDGSVRSPESAADDAVWISDRGQAGMSYILAYDPNARPNLVDPSGTSLPNQIGYFTAGQSADSSYLGQWDPERATLAVFANYLKFGYNGIGGAGANDWLVKYESVVRPNAVKAGLPDMPITEANLRLALRF